MSRSRTLLALAVAGALAAGAAIAAPQAAAPAAAAKPGKVKLDSNNDSVIDRAEAAKFPRLAERFDQMDRNKDGRLSADERPMHRGMKRGMRGHHGMGMKTKLDTDKDGRISRAEAAAAPKLAERFAQMDANKDGYLDRADREARMQERRAKWFSDADSNRDGQISRAEYDAAHAKRMAERQQRMKDAPKR